jgi:SHS2 domain-containing protein
MESEELPVPGVRELDHTADVGLEITAPDLPELFRRSALGAMWLVLEREVEGPGGAVWDLDAGTRWGPGASAKARRSEGETRVVELVEEDLPDLLRAWLRTLLFWEETEGFVVVDPVVTLAPAPLCSSDSGQAFGLRARVRGWSDRGPRVREIKGVTLHGLVVERVGDAWQGRVIFDV